MFADLHHVHFGVLFVCCLFFHSPCSNTINSSLQVLSSCRPEQGDKLDTRTGNMGHCRHEKKHLSLV